jgi:hypothetical protein
MNWRRGLFRLWAGSSLVWVAVLVVVACVELPVLYKAAYIVNTYEFRRADGSKWEVRARTFDEANKVNKEYGGEGPIIPPSLFFYAPDSAPDSDEVKRLKDAFERRAFSLASFALGPPALLGVLMLTGGWVVRGFRG